MTTTTTTETTNPSANCLREAIKSLDGLHKAASLIGGISAMVDRLTDSPTPRDVSSLGCHLRDLVDMAVPRIDEAIGGFCDAICELERVAPLLVAQARMEGEAHV